jgi:hypothetical protein
MKCGWIALAALLGVPSVSMAQAQPTDVKIVEGGLLQVVFKANPGQ